MDLSSLYAADWVVVDDLIVIDLLKRTDGVYAPAQSVAGVMKNAEAKADAVQGNPATMDAVTTAFHLWTQNLGGVVPDKGDKIVEESGDSWHVTRVQPMDRKTRYRCECRLDRTA